ncbi:glucarate dehydratase family protein [Streptomyces sp. NPDC059697]|uniref:glucarate dehydratase family protein n=1 Tax=Streptomyces sp. NPDC059697 TaxID=3346912 RepID=UPI0036BD5349
MLITSVEITPIAVQDPPLLNSEGVHQTHALRSVIRVHTDEGLTGLGETYGDDQMLVWLRAVARKLPGTDPFATNVLMATVTEVMEELAGDSANEVPVGAGYPMAGAASSKTKAAVFSAFEVACLDIQGKALGRPLHDLLGGKVRDAVPYSAYLFYKWAEHPDAPYPADSWGEALTPDAMVAQARRMVETYGFTSLKLKGGVLRPGLEVDTVLALHGAFPDYPIRIDPNAAWTVDVAVEVGQRLEGALEYLEDPVGGTPAMAEVARKVSMPLATNMCVTAFEDIPEAVREGAPQVILSDHHFWGGMRQSQVLDGICQTFGLSLSMHSNTHLGISLAAMTHFGAVSRSLAYSCDTHTPWQTEEIIVPGTLGFENGAVRVPDGPGLGVELDEDAVARLHEQWVKCGVRTRDDVTPMRAVHPEWTGETPRFTSL